MDGQCARVSCARPASVLLVFDPRETWALLRDYQPGDRVVGIHLCDEHAEHVTVPAGWELRDERTATPHLTAVPSDDTRSEAAASQDTEPPTPAADASGTEPAQSVAGGDASPDDDTGHEDDDEDAPTLWPVDEAEPIDELEVDESTPLLSRAFRAAHLE